MPGRCACFDRRLRPGRGCFAVAATPARRPAVTAAGHAEALDPQGLLHQREVAMRPARIIAVFVFAAAVAVTGCTARTPAHPPPAPPPSPPPAPNPTPPPTTKPTPPTTPDPGPHRLYFATPQASMRYLAV